MGPAHFGIALAAKPLAPKAPVWALLVAGNALDGLFFGLAAVGIERAGVTQADISQGIRIVTSGSIPWSHGLVMSLIWSILTAAFAYLLLRDRWTSGVMGLVVFSHWVLDFIVHLPDLPLFFAGSPNVGLGLWGTRPGLVASGILELALITGGMLIYFVWVRKKTPDADGAISHA